MCSCAAGKIDGVLNVKPSLGLSSATGKLFVTEERINSHGEYCKLVNR